jgi:hypothetical protein
MHVRLKIGKGNVTGITGRNEHGDLDFEHVEEVDIEIAADEFSREFCDSIKKEFGANSDIVIDRISAVARALILIDAIVN